MHLRSAFARQFILQLVPLALALIAASAAAPRFAHAAAPAPFAPPAAAALRTALTSAREKIDELAVIRTVAEQRGVRVFLTGDAATAVASYTQRDLQRQAGEVSMIPPRFDYYSFWIWRVNQTLTLAIDGDDAAAIAFDTALRAKVGLLAAETPRWTVRPLASIQHELDTAPIVSSTRAGAIELTGPRGNLVSLVPELGDVAETLRSGQIRNLVRKRKAPAAAAAEGGATEALRDALADINYIKDVYRFALRPRALELAAATARVRNRLLSARRWPEAAREQVAEAVNDVYTSAADIEPAYRHLARSGIILLARRAHDTYLLQQKPLPSRKPVDLTKPFVAQELRHVHGGPEIAAASMVQNPNGQPNILQSTPQTPNGAGFYTNEEWVTGSAYVELQMAPDAEFRDAGLVPGHSASLRWRYRDGLRVVAPEYSGMRATVDLLTRPVVAFDKHHPLTTTVSQAMRFHLARFGLVSEDAQVLIKRVRRAVQSPHYREKLLLEWFFSLPESTAHPELFAQWIAPAFDRAATAHARAVRSADLLKLLPALEGWRKARPELPNALREIQLQAEREIEQTEQARKTQQAVCDRELGGNQSPPNPNRSRVGGGNGFAPFLSPRDST